MPVGEQSTSSPTSQDEEEEMEVDGGCDFSLGDQDDDLQSEAANDSQSIENPSNEELRDSSQAVGGEPKNPDDGQPEAQLVDKGELELDQFQMNVALDNSPTD